MSAGKAVRGKASIREAFGSEALRSKASGREEAEVLLYRINRFHFNIQVENVVCHTDFLPSSGEHVSKHCCGGWRKRKEWTKLAAVAVRVAAHMSAGVAVGGVTRIGITFGRIALRTIALRRVKPKIRVYRINRFHLDIQIEIVVCHKYLLPSNVRKF
nr:hypothetical protein [Paenibacillus oleatilyticus]